MLRTAGIVEALGAVDAGDLDVGTLPPLRDQRSGLIGVDALATMVAARREAVHNTLESSIPFVVGGDCPLLLGCLPSAGDRCGAVRLLFVDVLSTSSLRAVDYQQPGGLDWNHLSELIHATLAVPGLTGVDLAIYNPDLDDGDGASAIVAFARETFGDYGSHAKRISTDSQTHS